MRYKVWISKQFREVGSLKEVGAYLTNLSDHGIINVRVCRVRELKKKTKKK